jgi:hypothetical protein
MKQHAETEGRRMTQVAKKSKHTEVEVRQYKCGYLQLKTQRAEKLIKTERTVGNLNAT